ncbi:hypothetical protein [uncultured Methylophaga sp.]|uniref:hypothetical protein n=1 Tax=uncultured Methylophaga sp. TaxID=285271 RepID=UPI00261BF7D4|nr:hypothetical protein [uncultured Methylophaga sp.]
MKHLIFITLLLLGPGLQAQTTAIEIRHNNGDLLTIQRLANGEVWGSLFLSDRTTASFASHELIVLQVDKHQPIKLQQGFRSCGAPAPKSQQVVYQFEQSESDWAFSGSRGDGDKPDVLKLLGWDADQYAELAADRRPEVVDFPLDPGEHLTLQMQGAQQLNFRYVTSRGEQRETIFHLAPHHAVLEQLLP